MTPVVFDTNVFISAFESGGTPRDALLLASTPLFQLCTSRVLLTELKEVLQDRFQYSQEKLLQIDARLARLCIVVEPTEELAVCSDPDDNRVLECAVAAGAACIVTGDKALLDLNPFRQVRILTPAEFLDAKLWNIRDPL